MYMKKQNLSITVSLVSYNDERILKDSLLSIREQDYNQNLVDILILDGGSIDNTIKIAEKYNAKVIYRPDLKYRPDIRAIMATTIPRTDLVFFYSADNRLQENDIFSRMVKVFEENNDVVACETLRYGRRDGDPILSRYFALIGGLDPIAIGLGKADRGPYDQKEWHSFGLVEDHGNYYKVKFEADTSRIPTIGANGCLIRREYIQEMDCKDNSAHIDMCVSLIQKGHDTFAFIKDSHVLHYIDVPLIPFLKRRLSLASMYSAEKIKRIYSVFHKKDIWRLIWIIVTYTTFIFPLVRSIRGYIKYRDRAWFLHPLLCFIFTVGYGVQVIKKILLRTKDYFVIR